MATITPGQPSQSETKVPEFGSKARQIGAQETHGAIATAAHAFTGLREDDSLRSIVGGATLGSGWNLSGCLGARLTHA